MPFRPHRRMPDDEGSAGRHPPLRLDGVDERGWTPRPAGDLAGELRRAVALRLPPALRAGVLDPGRRGLAALGVLAVVAAALGAWYFMRAQPSVVEGIDPPAGAVASSPRSAASAPASGDVDTAPMVPVPSSWATLGSSGPSAPVSSAGLVVDVVGRVRRPGIVEVDAGARIDDAVTAAGGALPGTDLSGLDLAAKVVDGEQIFVGVVVPAAASATTPVIGGVVAGPGAAGATPAATGAAVVDLNTAGLAELETLPGIGAVIAARILDWRATHGRFATLAQLEQVSGIGPAKYAGLTGRISL